MTALRIGIDARLAAYRRGMGNYIHSLLRELARLPTEHQFVLYVDGAEAAAAVPDGGRFSIRRLRPGLYPLWEQVLLPARAACDRLDVLHSPANTAPLCLPRRTRLVVTIHDVMYLLPRAQVPLPRTLYQRLGRQYRRWVVPRVARRAGRIISDSACSKTDTLQRIAVRPEGISVIYLSPSPRFRRLTEQERSESLAAIPGVEPGRPTIVHLGASDPRKNTERVLHAFAALKARASGEHQLVVAGLSPAAQIAFAKVADALAVRNDVRLLGFVAEDELVSLYNMAEMVVYPSLYEGFGLPVLEAMACGAPVITSNSSSIPEIAGDAALLVDPTDGEALAQAMIRLAGDEPLRRSLIARGTTQIAKFSWQRAARETLAVYEEVAQQ